MKIHGSAHRLTVGFLLVLASTACKTAGDYVTVDSLPPATSRATGDYVLQPGDTISIRVWNQDSITTRARIRPDGKVSLPFLDDVEAGGSTPSALAKRIQSRLKDYVVNPVVTVSLEEARPLLVAVLGEVNRPGSYSLETDSGVLQALAVAGGTTAFANRNAIFVIRQRADGGGAQRILFTYSELTQLTGRAAGFKLQGGDVVVVE